MSKKRSRIPIKEKERILNILENSKHISGPYSGKPNYRLVSRENPQSTRSILQDCYKKIKDI